MLMKAILIKLSGPPKSKQNRPDGAEGGGVVEKSKRFSRSGKEIREGNGDRKLIKYIICRKEYIKRLERWPSGEEHLFLFLRTQVWFQAPIWLLTTAYNYSPQGILNSFLASMCTTLPCPYKDIHKHIK